MARSLILSNNNMLVAYDMRGQISDLYFPHVGLENHIGRESVCRLGVFVEGRMSWLDEPHWKVRVEMERSTFVARITAENKVLGVKLDCTDIVYNEKNIYIRNVTVSNLADMRRDIKVYFAYEFELGESRSADTAYYDPRSRSVIHYKGRRAVLINAFTQSGQFGEFTVGEFGVHGKEGSFHDADDGKLQKNVIEHGRVDSVVGVPLKLEAGSEADVYAWVCVAESIPEVHDLNRYAIAKNPAYLINTTRDYWYAWVHKYDFKFHGLSEEVAQLFRQSLFMVHGATDDGGSILASADSSMLQGGKDTYAYMWPRDGAFAAMSIDSAGDFATSRRFFEFCADVISEDGYLMHKFRPDRSLGSSWHPWVRDGEPRLPIQEDETALPLIALKRHYESTRDIEFIEEHYNDFIKRAANFLTEYRDESTHLPYPSYDLWEEKYGVHTFTAATVYGALMAASEFAEMLGKRTSAERWQTAAAEVREAILEHLYDEEDGSFYKMINFSDGGEAEVDSTIDISSLYGVSLFGVLDPDDPRLEKALNRTREVLEHKDGVGGICRYNDDVYYQVDKATPGNAWVLTTLWLAQVEILKAKKEEDLESVKSAIEWCVGLALDSGVLPEQVHPRTGEPLSATPLTWSHAEFVLTVIRYLDKLEELGVCEACNPVKV